MWNTLITLVAISVACLILLALIARYSCSPDPYEEEEWKP